MYALGRGSRRRSINIWPGFVDALATLLLVVIFVLMVFMIAQYFLSVALSGRDEALQRLQREISTLADLLSLERAANEEMRTNVAEMSSELQASLALREDLSAQIAALTGERETLASQVATLLSERGDLASRLARADEERAGMAERLAALLAERDSLSTEVKDLDAEKARLAAQLAALVAERDSLAVERDSLSDRVTELDEAKVLLLAQMAALSERAEASEAEAARAAAELADAYRAIDVDKEKIEALVAEIAILESLRDEVTAQLLVAEQALEEQRDLSEDQKAKLADAIALSEEREEKLRRLRLRLSEVEETADSQTKLSEDTQRKVDLLNRQIASLRDQLAKLSEALDAADVQNTKQQVQIADLGRRLNIALASKVQELARYRSEFFGRLRKVLGDHPDIRIVGDRFVFQSEVLFESGSAELGAEGQEQMARLARTLIDISDEIPEEIDWVLRVDGHTDTRPIRTTLFPSNWELSTARAISVVKFLIGQGLSADRLAATGFGEFQPLDSGADEVAFRRNRRIELKLTQR
jgi:chemotaxis protein MotB